LHKIAFFTIFETKQAYMSNWSKIWKILTTPVNTPKPKEHTPTSIIPAVQCNPSSSRDHWLTVHVALASMREFQECNSDHTLLKKAENLRNIIEELKGLSGQSNYSAILKKGINEFETNWRTTITPQEFEHLEHPDKMDIDEMIREKYCSLASNYRRYWESAIAQLVRKSAILKRRQYLIEDIDRFIDGLPIKYPEVVSELEKYKAFNLKQIESPE
jgi:hypothetical protein